LPARRLDTCAALTLPGRRGAFVSFHSFHALHARTIGDGEMPCIGPRGAIR
jgi:hypothetical protein